MKGEMETHIEVRSLDADISIEEYRALPRHGLTIILDNIRSAFNVGAIFRLADVLRVEELILCGITAYPPHIKLEKTSMSTTGFVNWRHEESTVDVVLKLRQSGVTVWAAETAHGSERYDAVTIPEKVAVVFGNEALGVSPEVIAACNSCIEIPVYGFKNSLNVATSCAVIGYHIVETLRRSASQVH